MLSAFRVASRDASSTTTTSSRGYVDASADSRQGAMLRASFRAGMTTETSGGSLGGSRRSSSSERDRRARTIAVIGASTQGAAMRTEESDGTRRS